MSKKIQVLIERLDPDLPMPKYAKAGDAGFDIYARIDCVIESGQRALVPSGISLALPPGYVALVHPRSGLALKNGITIVNTPGTVDAGYRGEIQIILLNTDLENSFEIKRGDRIAQIVIQEVITADFVEVKTLPGSTRAAGGFGSTGSK